MASRQPSLDEFMKDPLQYPDYRIAMDEAGKFHIVMKAEARRNQDKNVFTGIYDPKSGGFFCWITFF